MAEIRLCPCGAPPVRDPWCWTCARQRQEQRERLGVIPWDAADLD